MPRRLSLLVVALAASLVATSAPVSAGSFYMSRTTGKNASAYWTQVDNTPAGSQFGNIHVGWLYAYETSNNVGDAFVYIEDFDCDPGVLPQWGYDGLEPGCVEVGSRLGEGFGMTLKLDKKMNSATLQGPITMSQPGHVVVGTPMADMTWTGTGATVKTTSTYRYNDGNYSYTDRFSSTERQATMSGNLGPMTFAPELSGGSLSTFKSTSRGRS